jgi:hypothetical protein
MRLAHATPTILFYIRTPKHYNIFQILFILNRKKIHMILLKVDEVLEKLYDLKIDELNPNMI